MISTTDTDTPNGRTAEVLRQLVRSWESEGRALEREAQALDALRGWLLDAPVLQLHPATVEHRQISTGHDAGKVEHEPRHLTSWGVRGQHLLLPGTLPAADVAQVPAPEGWADLACPLGIVVRGTLSSWLDHQQADLRERRAAWEARDLTAEVQALLAQPEATEAEQAPEVAP